MSPKSYKEDIKMNKIDKLVRDRSRIVLLMALTFAVWQGGQIVAKLIPEIMGAHNIADCVGALGAVAYAISAVFLYIYHRRVKKAKLGCTLNDEWARHVKTTAFQYGFFYMIGATSLLYGASVIWQFPAQPALQTIVVVGVVGTIFAYVWLERKGEVEQ